MRVLTKFLGEKCISTEEKRSADKRRKEFVQMRGKDKRFTVEQDDQSF